MGHFSCYYTASQDDITETASFRGRVWPQPGTQRAPFYRGMLSAVDSVHEPRVVRQPVRGRCS